jgi:hypothetical protein
MRRSSTLFGLAAALLLACGLAAGPVTPDELGSAADDFDSIQYQEPASVQSQEPSPVPAQEPASGESQVAWAGA